MTRVTVPDGLAVELDDELDEQRGNGPAKGGKTYDNIGPWTGEVIGHAADASAEDVDAAIAAARRAFDTTSWSTDHARRHELMKKFRDLLYKNRDRLVEIAKVEAGAAPGAAFRAQIDVYADSATASRNAAKALRDALEGTKNVAGAHGVFNMSPTDHLGLDLSAFRMLEIKGGDWTLIAPGT